MFDHLDHSKVVRNDTQDWVWEVSRELSNCCCTLFTLLLRVMAAAQGELAAG